MLALFSAIVTAFLVPSLDDVKQTDGAQTDPAKFDISSESFHPESSAIRANIFYSISLISGLSLAILAIAYRAYVNMAAESGHSVPANSSTDLKLRWTSAEALLQPTIETLPMILLFPVILFVAGLVDTFFSMA
ncbi:hypothetical protein MSAN_00861000 [Mycena sanguinolenta]|uniref:DUF6535 domain-containing protein n=1 Tax=Mycena sanguinolenta TaxID=230812 RepID=A0A8H6YWY9_9AGAR|nr:hypothetical protein MSAN_00861000 [Mycena sanguinolenta]